VVITPHDGEVHQTTRGSKTMSDQKLAALKATSIFASCTKKQLELIGKVTDRAGAPVGSTIVKEQTVPHQMAIIISGKVEVTSNGNVLAQLGPGDVIGELAMVDGAKASATVTVTEEVDLWMVARSGFIPVWEKNPDMSKALLEAVVARLRATNELIA
jgi:CRP/FNR family cyclic AMP-dependent transcriptional regulator